MQSPQTKSSKIWEVARNYYNKGSSRWSFNSFWGWNFFYYKTNKCNLFVYDVLIEAGAKAPNRKFVSLNFLILLCNSVIIFQINL